MRAADWVVLLQIRTLATETGVLCRVQRCRKNLCKILKRCRRHLYVHTTLSQPRPTTLTRALSSSMHLHTGRIGVPGPAI